MSGMIERAREASQQLADVAREHTENVRASVADMDLSAASAEKIQELLAAVDTAIPFVREAGYELVRAFVELGLPPRLVVGAHRVREISDEEETALRERAAASSMSSLVLRTFLGAAALQRTLSLRTFRASEIELEITTLPKVRLYFAHFEA